MEIGTYIVKIDSRTRSFCLCQYVQNGLSYSGKETRPKLKDAKLTLASDLLEQINISCYTEYKAFGPSLIYNTYNHKFFYTSECRLLWRCHGCKLKVSQKCHNAAKGVTHQIVFSTNYCSAYLSLSHLCEQNCSTLFRIRMKKSIWSFFNWNVRPPKYF